MGCRVPRWEAFWKARGVLIATKPSGMFSKIVPLGPRRPDRVSGNSRGNGAALIKRRSRSGCSRSEECFERYEDDISSAVVAEEESEEEWMDI